MNIKKISVIFPLFFIFFLVHEIPAFAHKVIVFAWVENGVVYTESSFNGGFKVHKGKIKVFDGNGKLVTSGITDDKGKFSFKVPDNIKTDLIVKLDAAEGHQAHWKIHRKELVKGDSPAELEKAMEKKKKMEEDPSFLSIITGLAIIFALAFSISFIRKKIKRDV